MAYILVLLGILAAFIWATPARGPVVQALDHSVRAVAAQAVQLKDPAAAHVRRLTSVLRDRAAALLREELHDAVDASIK